MKSAGAFSAIPGRLRMAGGHFVVALAMSLIGAVLFAPEGSKARQHYPAYDREAQYQPRYDDGDPGNIDPGFAPYPHPGGDSLPSFAVIILIIILIVLIIALFCPPIRGPKKAMILAEVRGQFATLRTANPGIAGALMAAETAIINRINND
jgi:hypothetical protein